MSGTMVEQTGHPEASSEASTTAFMTLIYKGPGGTDYALSTASFDGEQWFGNIEIAAEPGRLTPKSIYNPATCLYNNVLYIAYRATGDDDALYFSYYDGIKWAGDRQIRVGDTLQKSKFAPALCAFQGLMYMVHKAASSNEIILSSFDGSTWSGGKGIQIGNEKPLTNQALSAAVYNRDSRMYIAYKGDSTNKVYTAKFDGTRWEGGAQVTIPGKDAPKSNFGPAICQFGDRLYIVYKGESTDALYMASFDGQNWQGNNPISTGDNGSPKSNYTPGAMVFADRLRIVYKGASTNTLYTAAFDGSTWSGNTPIADQAGKIDPESNYNLQPCSTPWLLGGLPTWLSRVPDASELWGVNLAGTHDSAAINTSTTTLLARHFLTLPRQLAAGVRVLDIRLKVKQTGGSYYFVTCHGDAPVVDNEYQSFVSVLYECSQFLRAYPTEAIVMSLKIDDWNGYEKAWQEVFEALRSVLSGYPVVRVPRMVTLGEVRGTIYLVNRILIPDSEDPCTGLEFGVPICPWPDNTSQSCPAVAGLRDFAVYAQDNWKDLGGNPAQKKLEVFEAAIGQAAGGPLINFASATSGPANGQVVYMQEPLLNWLGAEVAQSRPQSLGWCLFDYESNYYQSTAGGWLVNCVQIVVASNFGYEGYQDTFQVKEPS